LAAAIEALEGEPTYPVEESKSGELTMSVVSPEGRRSYLHSRYRPREEAERLIQSFDFEKDLFFHVHGLGLGYHLELLFDRAGEEAIFCIFEPDLLLLRSTLQVRNFSKLLESRRVLIFTRLDKGDLFTRLNPQTPLVSLGTVDVDHPASLQRHPEFHAQMKAWLAEFASFGRNNMNNAGAEWPANAGKHRPQHRLVRRDPEHRPAGKAVRKETGDHRLRRPVTPEKQASLERTGGACGHHRGADHASAAVGNRHRTGFL